MRVLVTGANGFLGARIVAMLRMAGHEPVLAVRRIESARGAAAVACDMARDHDAETWKPRLAGIDAVVNCAGILRQMHDDTFQSVHVDAPLALFRACARSGVRRVIQISALGEPADGEFIASKHRCDTALAQLDLDWLVLRPGLVYSAHGAYGGTVLLRALAALPGLLVLPRHGAQELQPFAAEDLARCVVAALAQPRARGEILETVGPEILSLRAYLLAWRRWFGVGKPCIIATPQVLVDLTIACGEWWGRGPLCRVIGNLLQRRRVGSAQALARLQDVLGITPLTLSDALAQRPMQAQDLLEARWYVLRPLALGVLALVWIASGVVGMVTPMTAAQAMLPSLSPGGAHVLALGTSAVDMLLGVLLLSGWSTRVVLQLMLVMVLGYTVCIGVLAPQHWLDPFGGLLKNLPVAMLLLVLLLLQPRR